VYEGKADVKLDNCSFGILGQFVFFSLPQTELRRPDAYVAELISDITYTVTKYFLMTCQCDLRNGAFAVADPTAWNSCPHAVHDPNVTETVFKTLAENVSAVTLIALPWKWGITTD